MAAATKTAEDYLNDANELLRKKNREIAELRKELERSHKDNDTAEQIREVIWGLAAHNPEPPAWISGGGGTSGMRGCPITVWSDLHYGEVVNGAEINNVNTYNANIAKQRAFKLFDRIVDLSFNHMGRAKTVYPGIIVCMGGDMIGGDIHEELAATNDRTPQQAVDDLTDILAAGVEKMATKFGRAYVPCVVGNHGRATKKPRMKGRVFTNYDWSIYCNLARYFRKEKHIRIDVPNSADAHFKVFGSRYMLTHGDDLGVKGGDGIIGAIGPIMRGTLKIGQQQAKIGLDFDHLIICHWHQPLWLPSVFVNNAFKGPDEYSMVRLRAPPNRASQLLWFHHPEHGVTARWEVFLEGRRAATKGAPWVSWQDAA